MWIGTFESPQNSNDSPHYLALEAFASYGTPQKAPGSSGMYVMVYAGRVNPERTNQTRLNSPVLC